MKSFVPLAMPHARRHVDYAGAAVSGLCLVHCLLTPIAVSSFPSFVRWMPGDRTVHRILACVILLLGAAAFLPGYKVHRQPMVLALVAIGTSIVLTVAWCGETFSLLAEICLSVSGSLALITAHLLNRSFCDSCAVCEQTDRCESTGIAT